MSPAWVSLLSDVLRRPGERAASIEQHGTLAVDGPRLLAALGAGAASFGFVVGAQRSVEQGVYAALKMPVLLLLPLLLVLPALPALWRTCGVEVGYTRLAVATLVGAARSGILASAAAPLWWLASPLLAYHVSILAFVVTVAAIGAPGLWVIGHAVPAGGSQRWVARGTALALLGLCTMQAGWMSRPFVVRPAGEVVFLRAVDQDIFTSLGTTSRSAVGLYDEERAP